MIIINDTINLEELKKLKTAVKYSFKGIHNVLPIVSKYPFLKEDISYRIENNILFQPGRIVETLIIQSIASSLNCVYIGNGIYENEEYKMVQDGGSGKSDLIIIEKSSNTQKIYEIKEPCAYGLSCGFTYDKYGKPVEFTSKNDEFVEYVRNLFSEGNCLADYNILDNQGSNKYYSIDDLIMSNFDYIISYDQNGKILVMTKEEYIKEFNFKIEVRSCGRNVRKVYTPELLNLKGDYVMINKDQIIEIKQRGGKTSSRYKYIDNGATFSFNKKYIITSNNNEVCVPLTRIKQHNGEVAIQHYKN